MGGEIAQWSEWQHDGQIDWDLLNEPAHRGVQQWVRDLNELYRSESALHRRDTVSTGFRWVVGDDRGNSVFAFLRFASVKERPVLVVCNMTPVPRHAYCVGVPRPGRWNELLNSDAERYGGSNMGNRGAVMTATVRHHGEAQSLELTLPPLATLYLAHDAG